MNNNHSEQSDDMDIENLIFSVDKLNSKLNNNINNINNNLNRTNHRIIKNDDSANKLNNIDSYYVRYKLGISEIDLDSMCAQEKVDFCDFITKWRWGTSGSFFIGVSGLEHSGNPSEKSPNDAQPSEKQYYPTMLDVEKDITYLSKKFPYKIIVYFAGESNCDYCSKVFFAGSCEKFITIPADEINQMLYKYGICLRPLELFYRDPEFVDLDCIDICEF